MEQKHLFNAQDNFDAEVDRAVAELNRLWRIHGTVMTDIEPQRRSRARELDIVMTDAANRGDLPAARAALKEWTNCFVPERSML